MAFKIFILIVLLCQISFFPFVDYIPFSFFLERRLDYIPESGFSVFLQSREKLSTFLMWAISTASKADSQLLLIKESHPCFTISSEEEIYEESLRSKLLRWLTAAVILGKLPWKSNDFDPEFSNRLKLGTLQSLWDLIGNARDESIQNRFGCENLLAAVIFYLQQHLGINCRVLPSVISALCLIFYTSSFAGKILNLV